MKHLDLLKVSLNAWKEKRISQWWFDGDLRKKWKVTLNKFKSMDA